MAAARIALLSVLLMAAASHAIAGEEALAAAGERLYREGVTPAGAPLIGRLRGGASLQGAQAACVTCHRRSGMGGSEGVTVVPPVTGDALYNPRDAAVEQLAYLSAHRARRPAYTDATLARLMRDGIDAAGREVGDPMPRYALTESELAALRAYLKALSREPVPGITDDTLHFATVVTEGVPAEQRAALLAVLQAFFKDKNGNTRHETRRATHGPWSMKSYRAWRRWELHVWDLKGPPSTWRPQLERHYRNRPVFAMVSGVAAGPWQEIDRFCESNRIPCLFPSTDLAEPSAAGFYTRYLSQGMALEARVAARHLREEPEPGTVIQLFGSDPESTAAAAVLRAELEKAPRHALEEHPLEAGEPGPGFWRSLLSGRRDVRLVLWMKDDDVAWASIRPWAGSLREVIVSATLLDMARAQREAAPAPVIAVQRFVLPEERERKLARMRAWLHRNGVAPREERVQADAYFAATAAAEGVMKMSVNFSREYFVERVEDMVDNALTSSVYPRVSLGVGQRYAAKGAYRVRLGWGEEERVWVVP